MRGVARPPEGRAPGIVVALARCSPAAAGTLGHVLAQRGFGGEAAGGEREQFGLATQRRWSCGLGVRSGSGLRGLWDRPCGSVRSPSREPEPGLGDKYQWFLAQCRPG